MSGSSKKIVVAIVGPTCTGKTALSLALAERLPAEIVACDSRTIYQEMDIGTAKPSAQEQALVRHHLIDVLPPDRTYTVAQYREEAAAAIDKIISGNRLPIVCGGTGFYARALLEGLDIPAVKPQGQLRAELNAAADRQGNEALHEQLRGIDPKSAERINANDRFRVVRALEVSIVMGKPFSELAGLASPPYRTIWIGLSADNRLNLKQAIVDRFSAQMRAGLLDEVQSLYAKYGSCRSLNNTVNYKELIDHFEGRLSREEAEELCITHNYQLARKQLIWFRANRQINWLAVDQLKPAELALRARELVCKLSGD